MTDKIARVWNGSEWVVVSSPVGVPNSIAVYQQEPPLSPAAGQLWIDSDSADDGNYFISSTMDLGLLVVDINNIQSQLDGKEKSIPLSSSAPISPTTSDLWVDNTDPAKPTLKVYNGTSWVTAGSSITVDDDQIILAQRMFT